MSDLTNLIARLEAAAEGAECLWCERCGMVGMGVQVLRRSRYGRCGEHLKFGTPQDCIAALRAREEK
jgi:hypothetical protein